jgi:ADP-ribose pyrophosphatase YjhB (NUDIX family)
MTQRARHCMACGSPLRTARQEGRRRRRCPRCDWTFYDNPVPAAVAVVTGRRGILLARRGAPPYAGTWDLPGGFLEADEAPERALVRELREELGARAVVTRLHGFAADRYGPGGFPVLVIVFEARLIGRPRPGSDVTETRWFRRDAVPWRAIGFASARRALRAYLGARPGPPGRRR